MNSLISGITSAIINSEIKDKNSRFILAKEIMGNGRIDANSDHQVTVDEIKNAATQAGINTDNLTNEQLMELEQDAVQLTNFIKTGGNLSKLSGEQNYNYDFVDDMLTVPSVSKVSEDLCEDHTELSFFRRGQSGPEIAKLNILLSNLGFKVSPGNEDKFTEETEKFVKEFQKNNNLLINPANNLPFENIIPGVIDNKTLKRMESSVKAENPYIALDNNINEVKTEFELIRHKVKEQLEANGIDSGKAFIKGENLTEGAVTIDRKMSSESLCYTAVKETLEKVLALPYERFGTVKNPETGKSENGAYAKTAGYSLLSKHPELFVKLEGFSRNDIQYLPPGAIVVYRPTNSSGKELTSEAGHIGIQSMQINGSPVVNVSEQDGKITQVSVKKRDNSIKTYNVEDGHAVITEAITDKNEMIAGKKFKGLTISSVQEENGDITSFKVKGYSKQKGTYYKTYEVKDNKVILEKYNIEHADISDKMRVKPWQNAKVEVYFPKG